MSTSETWTVRRLLQWTKEYFGTHGSDSPLLDAEILLANALGLKRIELYTNYEIEPPEPQRTAFREVVKRRAAGEPVAYLVGHKEFFSLEFIVNKNVLIPRSETELLVVETLDRVKSRTKSGNIAIADIGTGSGCVAISILKNSPNVTITAIDISREALSVASQNAEKHSVTDRIKFVESNLFANILSETKFDIVAANLPYISTAEYEQLQTQVKNYEPKQALLAGNNGTEIIASLITESQNRLNSGGTLLLELSPMIAADCSKLLTNKYWSNVTILKDDARLDRVLIADLIK
ncbi:MAG: peptide chain release factor N(5)-glutamine methyltransferase [Planctomycetaceae bacterium]|jgi:release factor glutamine methyltransferase|nr:peptide chain release factor N(5)-glutamine methyltransferase [Planctomycetaceae bacterium]